MVWCIFLTQIILQHLSGCLSQQPFAAHVPSGSAHSAASSSIMNLISSRDISELTQVATQFAAEAMKSNGKLIANSGPDVRPIQTDFRPSEMLGQGLTNMLQPARHLASFTLGATPDHVGSFEQKRTVEGVTASNMPDNKAIMDLANTFLGGGSSKRHHPPEADDTSPYIIPNGKSDQINGGGDMIGQAMRMFTRSHNSPSDSRPQSFGDNVMPTLRQLFPGAEKNFGIRQGDGCLPFLGEFMKMAYGNCVKRADEKAWDAWGNEINNALTGGKIDLLRASKETCKMGAEREQCGQLRKAISECDILGSIQLASNMQRSITRCDEITGLMDQNPGTILNQMNGLINGEVAQGLLNNFLGG